MNTTKPTETKHRIFFPTPPPLILRVSDDPSILHPYAFRPAGQREPFSSFVPSRQRRHAFDKAPFVAPPGARGRSAPRANAHNKHALEYSSVTWACSCVRSYVCLHVSN